MKLNPIRRVDLNGDVGELEGPTGLASDRAFMRFISSANIACGGHAGSETRIQQTIEMAIEHRVAIGAHPGYEDRANFGRLPIELTRLQVADLVERQVARVLYHTSESGVMMTHVKPHGALYNTAAYDATTALGVLDAMKRLGPGLCLVALANSMLVTLAREHGIAVIQEFFADRQYQADGRLVSRQESDALLGDPDAIADRTLKLLEMGEVLTVVGTLFDCDLIRFAYMEIQRTPALLPSDYKKCCTKPAFRLATHFCQKNRVQPGYGTRSITPFRQGRRVGQLHASCGSEFPFAIGTQSFDCTSRG